MGDSCLTTTECNKISYAHSIQSHVSSHNYSAKNIFYIVEMQDSYLPTDNFSQTQKVWHCILKNHLYTSGYEKHKA